MQLLTKIQEELDKVVKPTLAEHCKSRLCLFVHA